MPTIVLNEKLVKEGAQAWREGLQRWAAWNAILRNHVDFNRMDEDEAEAHIDAAMAEVRAQDRHWLEAPDVW